MTSVANRSASLLIDKEFLAGRPEGFLQRPMCQEPRENRPQDGLTAFSEGVKKIKRLPREGELFDNPLEGLFPELTPLQGRLLDLLRSTPPLCGLL